VFESKFILPLDFSEEVAAAKYMSQLQHDMWVVAAEQSYCRSLPAAVSGSRPRPTPIRSINIIMTAERKFWRCVETDQRLRLFGLEPPKPRIEAVRIVDMTSSNAWAEFARSRNSAAPVAGRRVLDLAPQARVVADQHGGRRIRQRVQKA
jgi:hypothetical protein